MNLTGRFGKQALAAVVCAALVFWTLLPSFTHSPDVFETIQDHMEMVEAHGHSHGFEEDLYWAMHGHSHDVTDHDHSQAFLMPNRQSGPSATFTEAWQRVASVDGPTRQFRIERPPRA